MPSIDPLDIQKTVDSSPSSGNGHGASLSPGDMLGQYRVIRLLGRGGMGEVYEVEHEVLRRRYALKLLPADFANRPGALERFKREALAMANLDHPNIVKVDDFGQVPRVDTEVAAGRHWLRMELAEGGEVRGRKSEVGGRKSEPAACHVRSLVEYAEAKGGRLDPDEAEVIFRQVLEGLAHAHARGVIHRDLKPANILICADSDGVATFKISDFGLVRMVGEEWVLSQADQSIRLSMSLGGMPTEAPSGAGTSTRSLIGTYEYMSPEQKRGEDATAASDVYAVGLMMYRLLTGRQQPGFKRPSEMVGGLDAAWDRLLLTALDEDAADRFADAGAMLAAWRPPRKPAPPAAPPAPVKSQPAVVKQPAPRKAEAPAEVRPEEPAPVPPAPDWQPPRRNWTGWVVAAVIVLVVVLALAGGAIQARRQRDEAAARRQAEIQERQREEARLAAERRQREATVTNPSGQRGPVPGQNWVSPATGMEFVWIKAMNCWVGKYEVTNGEYRKKEPSHDSKEYNGHTLNGDRQPVVYVNFDDAKAYAAWLTNKDKAVLAGASYRLPTKKEWETFAQCGDGREYPWGNNWPPRSGQAGNYHGQEGAGTWSKIDGYRDGHPVTCNVEQSWANPWGLYGVGGNVWECASESPAGSFGAWRGASWIYNDLDILRCSGRSNRYGGGSARSGSYGFRVLLSR